MAVPSKYKCVCVCVCVFVCSCVHVHWFLKMCVHLCVHVSVYCTAQALLMKAEAHYAMGEFEWAMVDFHRGLQRRPEIVDFRRGVDKCTEAVDNAVGSEFHLILLYPCTQRHTMKTLAN